MRLWKEKLGLEPPFKGNSATRWGTKHEATALAQFRAWADGVFAVHQCSFGVLEGSDARGRPLSWIGASPDGVLLPAQTAESSAEAEAAESAGAVSAACDGAHAEKSSQAVQRWQWARQQLHHVAQAEPASEVGDAVARLRLDSTEPAASLAAHAASPAARPLVAEDDTAQRAGSTARVPASHQWPHLQRFPEGKGILEIKCPFRLCAPLHPGLLPSWRDLMLALPLG